MGATRDAVMDNCTVILAGNPLFTKYLVLLQEASRSTLTTISYCPTCQPLWNIWLIVVQAIAIIWYGMVVCTVKFEKGNWSLCMATIGNGMHTTGNNGGGTCFTGVSVFVSVSGGLLLLHAVNKQANTRPGRKMFKKACSMPGIFFVLESPLIYFYYSFSLYNTPGS